MNVMAAAFILKEDRLILGDYEDTPVSPINVFCIQKDNNAFLVNGSLLTLEGQPVILQNDENIDQYCIQKDSSSPFLISLDQERTPKNASSNSVQFFSKPNIVNDEGNSDFLYIQDEQVLSDDAESLIKPKTLSNSQHCGNSSDLPLETEVKNVDLSQFKGRDVTTGEALTLESYLQRGVKRLKKQRETAEYFGRLKNTREYQLEKCYRTLINKKIDIGKTTDGRKVVGKIVTIKKSENFEQNKDKFKVDTSNTAEKETNNHQIFTTYDDHNFMAKTTNDIPIQDEITDHRSDAGILDNIDITEILEDHRYTDLLFETIKPDDGLIFDNLSHHNYSLLSKANIHENAAKIDNEKKKQKANKIEKPENLGTMSNEYGYKKSYNYCYTCMFCKRRFSRLSTLQKHVDILHNGQKPAYTCSFCGCSYYYVSSLTRHIVQNHVDKKTGKFKDNDDSQNLCFEVPAAEIITEHSILLEEDINDTHSSKTHDDNIKTADNEDCSSEQDSIESVGYGDNDVNKVEENEMMEIPIVEVDEATLLEMEKCGQIVEKTGIIDGTGSSENFVCQLDDAGNLYCLENTNSLQPSLDMK